MAQKPTYEELEQRVKALEREAAEFRKAEERLHTSARRLKTLFDFIPYPTVVFTLDGLVSFLNPAFTETFGWRLEELEGM